MLSEVSVFERREIVRGLRDFKKILKLNFDFMFLWLSCLG